MDSNAEVKETKRYIIYDACQVTVLPGLYAHRSISTFSMARISKILSACMTRLNGGKKLNMLFELSQKNAFKL